MSHVWNILFLAGLIFAVVVAVIVVIYFGVLQPRSRRPRNPEQQANDQERQKRRD